MKSLVRQSIGVCAVTIMILTSAAGASRDYAASTDKSDRGSCREPVRALGPLQEPDHAQSLQVDAKPAVAPTQNGVLLCVLLAYPQMVQLCTILGGNALQCLVSSLATAVILCTSTWP
jgi:hypothetical protein